MFDINQRWLPMALKPEYGLIPMISTTIYVTLFSTIIAMLFGSVIAIFLVFYINEKVQQLILSFIQMIAGIPSVIVGFLGLTLIVPFIRDSFNLSSGHSVLAAIIVLSIMLLPFVVETCFESIVIIKKKYYKLNLSLGMSKENFIIKILIKKLRLPLLSSFLLSFGRGVGETMAVMMVIGNSVIFPHLLSRAQTIPALIALEMGSVEIGSMHMSVLYTANLVLLIILLFTNLLAKKIIRKVGVDNEK